MIEDLPGAAAEHIGPAGIGAEVVVDATLPGHIERPIVLRDIRHVFNVHALFKMPTFADLEGVHTDDVQPQQKVLTSYYDTEDLRLSRWGVLLRRCVGGTEPGWLLRLPGNEEIRLPEGKTTRVPVRLSRAVTAYVRRDSLAAVATLSTDRTITVLRDAEDIPLAAVVDDVVSVLDNGDVKARYREVAVDALSADTDVQPIADALIAMGAIPTTLSEAVHALGPAASADPEIVEPARVSPHDPAGAAVVAHIATNVRKLMAQDARVREGLPDAVHQMRVAARRIRSGLRVFRPLIDNDWSFDLRTELGWLASELGGARDIEVLLERLDEHTTELPEEDARRARAVIDGTLQAQFEDATREALAALNSDRYVSLLEMLVAAVRDPQLTEQAAGTCRDVLPDLVDKSWVRLRDEAKALHLDTESEVWHEARITAKKARYAAEAVIPVFGSPAKKMASALSEVTEILGTHQDCFVSQQTLRSLSDDVDGPTGFALGLLHALEVEHELIDRIEFHQMWPQVRATIKRITLV